MDVILQNHTTYDETVKKYYYQNLKYKNKIGKKELAEYSCAATPQIRQTGNRLSGLAETAYASLLAQCFV